MRLIFMGSPQFAVPSLELLHASHEIIAVVTQPDRPVGRKLKLQAPAVKIAAHSLGIPVFQPTTTKTAEFVEEMKEFQPDVLIVVAYGEILRQNLLEVAPFGAVNLHASLLPKYRGAAPIVWAILNGEEETGCSTMKIVKMMDAGDVYLQERCKIHPSDTAETLSRKMAQIGAPLLKRTLELIEKNEIQPQPQDETQVSFAPKLKKEDGRVDWNRPADWISRQIRAFNPWPTTFTTFGGTSVKLWLAHSSLERVSAAPGTVIRILKHSIAVACGEGTVLEIFTVQPENRPQMTALEFINGYHVVHGAIFV
jgi:methionyl-tRNA formyltransferase